MAASRGGNWINYLASLQADHDCNSEDDTRLSAVSSSIDRRGVSEKVEEEEGDDYNDEASQSTDSSAESDPDEFDEEEYSSSDENGDELLSFGASRIGLASSSDASSSSSKRRRMREQTLESSVDPSLFDEHTPLMPCSLHNYYDAQSVIRKLSSARHRDKVSGLMMLKDVFCKDPTVEHKSVLTLRSSFRIYRCEYTKLLQSNFSKFDDQYSSDLSVYPWFVMFLCQSRMDNHVATTKDLVKFTFHPLEMHADFCASMQTISFPVTKISNGDTEAEYINPRSAALFIAQTFLQPELVCPSSKHAVHSLFYPYMIEVAFDTSAPNVRRYMTQAESGSSSCAVLLNGAARRPPITHRILVWRNELNNCWSEPLDVDFDDADCLLRSLNNTWPRYAEWLHLNLGVQNSIGRRLWQHRRDLIRWELKTSLCNMAASSNTELYLYQLGNRLVIQNGKMRHEAAPYSAQSTSTNHNGPWRDSVSQMSSNIVPYDSILSSPTMLQLDSQDVILRDICPSDLLQFVPTVPSHRLFIHAESFNWLSSKTTVIAISHFHIIVEVACLGSMLSAGSDRKDGQVNVVLKLCDIARLSDHHALVGHDDVNERSRCMHVEAVITNFRRELWLASSISPHRNVARFHGWTMFGSMIGMCIERMDVTFSEFMAYVAASCRTLSCRNKADMLKEEDDTPTTKYLSVYRAFLKMFGYSHDERVTSSDHIQLRGLQQLREKFNLEKASIGKMVRVVLKAFMAVCKGCAHLHSQGVVHRDLKPSNIMMSIPDKWTPKIIDLGCAAPINARIVRRTLGTALWQPVGFMDRGAVGYYYVYDDGSVDVYAVLVMLKKIFDEIMQVESGDASGVLKQFHSFVTSKIALIAEKVLKSTPHSRLETISKPCHNGVNIASDEHVQRRRLMVGTSLTAPQLSNYIKSQLGKIS